MIQNGKVTNSGNDTQNYPTAQVKYKGNVVEVLKVMPYPLIGSPLERAEALMLATNGSEEQQAAIFHEPKRRLKGFKAGEGGIGNAVTGNYFVMLNDGTTELYTLTDLIAKITENVIATFKEMALTGETINITADVNVTGNVATTGTLQNNGKDVGSTHTHNGVTTGGGNTGTPN